MWILVLNFLKSYAKEIMSAILIAAFMYWAYSSVYNKGVNDTNMAWEARVALQEKVRDEQISRIENFSKVTLEQTLINNEKDRKDLSNILITVKGKPTTVIKDGKCIPSDEFVSTYNSLINRANQK